MTSQRRSVASAVVEQRTSSADGRSAPHTDHFSRLRIVLSSQQPQCASADKPPGRTIQAEIAAELIDPVLAGRTVLVVDDEPLILEVLAEHCAALGMKVLEAADGTDALTVFQARPEIEVLVTDVRMPGLDGPALVERALALRPEIKVIFVTGYTTYSSPAWPILRKPFDLRDLEEALRTVLAPEGPAQ